MGGIFIRDREGVDSVMRFALVDRVVEVIPGKRIVAAKAVSRAEEYLADHFPTFEVLPGVLMLEALVEAARWLVWASEDFAHSVILLREAKNVTFTSFVTPGRILRLEVTCRGLADDHSEFAGVGYCEDNQVVKARFGLIHANLADNRPEQARIDTGLREAARSRWALLCGARAYVGSASGNPGAGWAGLWSWSWVVRATHEEVRRDGDEPR